MVEIREDSSEQGEGSSSNRQRAQAGEDTSHQSESQSRTENSGGGGSASANPIAYLKARPVDTLLWILRILTVVFGFLYAFPFIGGPQQQANFYSKALMAGAATNALRLHQRLGGLRLSREFFSQMFLEDSCHYLFYCIIFLGSYPVTMALMPVFLFAVLHASSFGIQFLNNCGMSGNMLHRLLVKLVEGYSQSLLTVIACAEIFIMPMVIVMIFMGRGSILIPFIYYRFLSLRYLSRRNPNTRMAFYQMRVALEQSVNRPQCPALLKNGVHRIISLIGRLCPTAAAA